MSLGLAGKLISGTLVLATTSVGGVLLNNHLAPKTIGDALHRDEKLNLLTKDYEKWKELVSKHKDTNNKPTKIEGLSFSQSDSGSENTEEKHTKELQDKCTSLWNAELSATDKNAQKRMKQELKDWCVTNPKALETN